LAAFCATRSDVAACFFKALVVLLMLFNRPCVGVVPMAEENLFAGSKLLRCGATQDHARAVSFCVGRCCRERLDRHRLESGLRNAEV